MSFFLHGEVATWEIVILENVHFGSCCFGRCIFGKLPLAKLSLGKLPLGKCLFESCTYIFISSLPYMLLKHIYWTQIFAHIFTKSANFLFVYCLILILQTVGSYFTGHILVRCKFCIFHCFTQKIYTFVSEKLIFAQNSGILHK